MLLLSHHAKLKQDPQSDFFLVDLCVFVRACWSGDQGVTKWGPCSGPHPWDLLPSP